MGGKKLADFLVAMKEMQNWRALIRKCMILQLVATCQDGTLKKCKSFPRTPCPKNEVCQLVSKRVHHVCYRRLTSFICTIHHTLYMYDCTRTLVHMRRFEYS